MREYNKREKHKCKKCDILTFTTNIYCSRKCYNEDHRIEVTCFNCGKKEDVVKNRSNQKYCSIRCANSHINRKESNIKSKITIKEKYGVENPFEIKGYNNLNIKRNNEKLSETYHQKSKEEKEKISKKISNSLNNISKEDREKIIEKVKQTNIKKFGDITPLSYNSNIRERIIKKYKENNKISKEELLFKHNLELLEEYKGVRDNNDKMIYYKIKHIPSGNIFIDHMSCGRIPIYKDPNETIGISRKEKELQEYLLTLIPKEELIFNNRKLVKGFEIDVYLPNYNLAIEFNGIKWHSESMGKDRLYHLNKTNKCNQQNVQLIHIFEDEWDLKKDIIKSKINHLLYKNKNKIYARKCEIREVNNLEKNNFLNENHIQGGDKSKIKLGLYHNNELISIMTFGNLRKIMGLNSKIGSFELLRFCNKKYTNNIGSFSKLLKYFIKNYKPKQLISYADRRYSEGKVYEVNNFKFIKNTPPNYWYMKYWKRREHRYKYRKSELKNILNNFNPLLSEWENMKLNNYDRIWDCGSKKYELNFD